MRGVQDLVRVPMRPGRSDYLVAGVLGTWALVEALLASGPGTRPARVLVAIGLTAPLLFRRRAPLLTLAAIAAVFVPWALSASEPEQGAIPFPCILVATFSVALYVPSTVVAGFAGLVPVALLGTAIGSDYWSGDPQDAGTDVAILFFFVGGAWTAGRLLRQRALQAADAERAGGEAAREAVRAERGRIARELHDIVAHAVSLTAIQAGAAEELIERDPAAAREHLRLVRQTAREALDEMRRLLDVLEPEDPAYAPQPGLARVVDLVDAARASGLPVEYTEDGEPAEVPAGVDLAAFRIVQEALTNVRKHAGVAPTRVAVRYRAEAVDVEVVNAAGTGGDPHPARGGRGLVGMRERARIYGGHVEARADGHGGFVVRATLPLHQEARL